MLHTTEMDRLSICFFVVFLLSCLGKCEESGDLKHHTGDDYDQIFRSLPTLFEYLLQMLEKQTDLLEKNEISFFQDIMNQESKEDVKREVEESDNIDDDFDDFKDYPDSSRETSSSEDISDVEELPDLTISNEDCMDAMLCCIRETEANAKRYELGDTQANYKLGDMKMKFKKIGKKNIRDKRNIKNFGNSFLGSIDWTKSNLTPEEVEEQTLKTEKAIEDYHRNKNKER